MTTVLTPDIARQLQEPLRQVCNQIGVDAGTAHLIKYTMNAVYRVGPYVVRLSRGMIAATRAETICTAAQALVDAGVPIIRPAVAQPVHVNDWVATVWHYVDTVDVAAQPVDLVHPLQAIHRLRTLGTNLPTWDPITKFRRRLAEARSLPAAQGQLLDDWSRAELRLPASDLLNLLDEWCDEAATELARVNWVFPAGVIHGDAHTGNLLLRSVPVRPAADPLAIICDPDGICQGQQEWDLSATGHGVTRFGRSRAEYDRFAEAIGFDVTAWTGWLVIVRIRELQLVTATIASLFGRPAVARELALRLRSLLNDDTAAVWSRHG